MAPLSSETSTITGSPNPDKTIRIQRADEYPHEVWFFLACLIALVTTFRFISLTTLKCKARSSSRSHKVLRLPLALVNLFRVIAFRFTLDLGPFSLNLAEVVLTMMYIAALFTWEFINTTDLSGGKLDEQYWSNRAGALIASQLPLITALGTKNNILTFVTGVSYENLNYLHRMASRVVFVLVWTHAGSKIYSGFSAEELEQTWLRCGLLAGCSFTTLCVISIRPVRARAYEFFFYTHLVLVLLILVGAYHHTKEFSFQTYIWPSFVIWGVDRFARALRMILFKFGSGSGQGALDATVELLTPRCVAYLISPDVATLPFESHPFTIASYDSQMVRKELDSDSSSSTKKETESTSMSDWKELVFLINVQEGFTKRLADIAAQKSTVKIYLDGPYGASHNSDWYDTVIFVAGGTGVSHTLPLLLDTIERVRNRKSICRRATFIWCIRDPSHIQWISNELAQALSLAPDSLKISIRIFITGFSRSSVTTELGHEWTDGATSRSSSSAESTPVQTPISEKAGHIITSPSYSASALASNSLVNVSEGRPSLANLLKEEGEETRGGSMWVTVCGSKSIATAVRRGLQLSVAGPLQVLRGGASVTLHVESFGYA